MFKDGRWIIGMIVGLLGVSVVANVILIVKAHDDPSFAVEPDYYQKAVSWDERQAARAASEDLGWRVVVRATRDRLEVRLFDRTGYPINDADLEVEAFHNARASARITADLEPKGGGLYALNRSFNRPGIWEYRLTAHRGDEHFMETLQQEVH